MAGLSPFLSSKIRKPGHYAELSYLIRKPELLFLSYHLYPLSFVVLFCHHPALKLDAAPSGNLDFVHFIVLSLALAAGV
jgi:hypothetical protein